MPAASSREAALRLRRELVSFNHALRSCAAAAVVLLAIIMGAAPAAAFWQAFGSGSTTASVATLGPPTNVEVPAGSDSLVAVNWTGSAGSVVPEGYFVTRTTGTSTAPACGSSRQVLLTGTSCTDSSVPQGTHSYQVTAVYRSWTAVSAASGNVTVVSPSSLRFSVHPPATVAAGEALTVSVQARTDLELLPVPGVPITLGFGNNPGGGTLSGTLSAVTDSSGTATFNEPWINKAGEGYSLTASAQEYAAVASNSFTVVPGAASSLVVTAGAALSGQASATANLGPVTLQRLDAYGNAVTSGATAVSLASTSSGTTAFAATANGTATTAVTIPEGAASASFFYGDTKAGTASITAAAAGMAPPAPISATVTAAAPWQLFFTSVPKGPVEKNKPFPEPVKVAIQDAFGNQTSSSAAISLRSLCTLKNAAPVNATTGVAVFTTLEVAGKGQGCTLTASSGTLLETTSTPFDVV